MAFGSQNFFYGGRRAAAPSGNEGVLGLTGGDSSLAGRVDGALGFLRGYVASVGAGKSASDFRYILANPQFRRLFSSEAPKKKSKLFFFFLVLFTSVCAWYLSYDWFSLRLIIRGFIRRL